MLTGLLVGCSHDDARLQGTWKSNREETLAAFFKADPKWAAATPERKEVIGRLFGNMTITYSNQVVIAVTPSITVRNISTPASTNTGRYKVIERGPTHVLIELDGETDPDQGNKRRIEFVDGDKGYWIELGLLIGDKKEKFDRVSP